MKADFYTSKLSGTINKQDQKGKNSFKLIHTVPIVQHAIILYT